MVHQSERERGDGERERERSRINRKQSESHLATSKRKQNQSNMELPDAFAFSRFTHKSVMDVSDRAFPCKTFLPSFMNGESTKEKACYLCPISEKNNQSRTSSIVQSQYDTYGKEICVQSLLKGCSEQSVVLRSSRKLYLFLAGDQITQMIPVISPV